MLAYVVIGLFYGDEGKGHTVAELTRRYNPDAVVRFSGGSQAAHRVVEHGRSHIFAQFGSGSAVSENVKTFLSDQMVIDPLALLDEAKMHKSNGLGNLLDRLYIHPECPIITPWHIMLNRSREINRDRKISTTGMGVGEVFLDLSIGKAIILKAKDLRDKDSLIYKLHKIAVEKLDVVEGFSEEAKAFFIKNTVINLNSYLEEITTPFFIERVEDHFMDRLNNLKTIVLEGSQGTLLDPDIGESPYITKGKVCLSEATHLLSNFNNITAVNFGVIRAYMTRHGIGPFPSEDEYLTSVLPDKNNIWNEWQRDFRVGWLDIDLLKYSINCNKGLDAIIITNFDRLPTNCFYFGNKHKLPITKFEIPHLVESKTYKPVIAISCGEERRWCWSFFG